MQEVFQQLVGLLRGIWHRRWIGLATAWIAAILGVALVYRIPERYEATARVYVDTESLLRPLLAGLAIQPNLDQQVSLMSRTLISRPNVERLIRMADLDLRAPSNTEREELIVDAAAVVHVIDDDDALRTALRRLLETARLNVECHQPSIAVEVPFGGVATGDPAGQRSRITMAICARHWCAPPWRSSRTAK